MRTLKVLLLSLLLVFAIAPLVPAQRTTLPPSSGTGLPAGCTPNGPGITCTGTFTGNIGSFNSVGTNFTDVACGSQSVGNANQDRFSCNGQNQPVVSINGGPAQTLSANLCTSFPVPGAYTPTNTAGVVECLTNGTYTIGSLQTISANNITILCNTKAAIIQRTTTTGMIKFTGNFDSIIGCDLDGNSQTGAGTAPLVEMAGNDGLLSDLEITNPGTTNPSLATLVITNGNRNKIRYVSIPSDADGCAWIRPTSAGTWFDNIIDHVVVTSYAPTVNDSGCILVQDGTGSGLIAGAQITYNRVYLAGASGINTHGIRGNNNIAPTSASVGHIYSHNLVTNTVSNTSAQHYQVFGHFGGIFDYNTADDNGFNSQNLFNFGDTYRSSYHGNVGRSNGISQGMHFVDYAQITVDGNVLTSIGNAGFGIGADTTGGNGQQSTFTGNTVLLSANADCYKMNSNASGKTISDDVWSANVCVGTSAANQNCYNLTFTAGTMTDISILNGHCSLLGGTGWIVGGSVTRTTIASLVMHGVTTEFSDSGTNTIRLTATQKLGSGGGNYSSASTTYTAVDGTNLTGTFFVPTGRKLAVSVSGSVSTLTAAATASVELWDGTCGSGTALAPEVSAVPTAAGNFEAFSLNATLTGNDASHTINLCYKTSAGADSVTMINSSATATPAMVFSLL